MRSNLLVISEEASSEIERIMQAGAVSARRATREENR